MGGNLNTFRAASPRRSRTLAGAVWIMAATMVAAAAGGGAWAQDVPALRARAAALSAEAERVEDANDIKKLQRAYGYYLDKGYWGEAADLFADDATFEWGVDGVYVGKGRIREYLVRQGGGNVGPGLPYGQFNHHMQLQPVVNVSADGKTAKARWQELALIGQFQKFADWATGVYENEYVRQDGVWKIKTLRFYPTFTAPYETGWAKLKPVDGDWRSPVAAAFPPDRPPTRVYQPFPAVFVAPFHYKGDAEDAPARGPVAKIAKLAKGLTASARGHGEGGLDAKLDDEARRLAVLRSHDAIENLTAAYAYYVDGGRWKEAAALFSAHGSYEYGQQGVYMGRARIRKALAFMGPEGLKPGQLNTYITVQPIIDVAPDNKTAKARWRSDVMLAADGEGRWSEGVYENDYVNEGGVWRIAKLHYYVTMIGDYEKSWVAGAIPLPPPSKTFPPDAPPTEIYRSLPGVYLPTYHYKNPVTGR